MKLADFQFDLPDELIARYPMPERTGSRLLILDGDSGGQRHGRFADIEALLRPGDLLVFNDTRVIPARLFGQKASGGQVEVLVERIVAPTEVLAHVRASKAPKPGSCLRLADALDVEMLARQGDLFHLRFDRPVLEALQQYGQMPLPPYMDRAPEAADQERYQTVYARDPGSVAAPTAGLHFDEPLLARLRAAGIDTAFVTLHVGAGTFQPVRVDDIRDHRMHHEWLSVPAEVAEAVRRCKARGGRVVAVGTTSVRSLETVANQAPRGELIAPFAGETDIFIYPGYQWQVVDALITNFHLPGSTLLMLVCAFAGQDAVLAAYRDAIAERYRFFSYGDAMFLTRRTV